MYRPTGYGAAGARYRSIDVTSRVEGASPHRLIQVLFEELMTAIEATVAAQRTGDLARRADKQTRALAILHALEASLDHARGGDVAAGLQAIYREARRLIVGGVQEGRPELLGRALTMLGEIAEAWRQIG